MSFNCFGGIDMRRDLHLFADDTEIGQGCRMRVTLREEFSLMPQLFHLEIENLSESSAEMLANCREMAVRSNGSVLAVGDSIFCCPRWIDGRKVLAVSFSYGFRLWKAAVSLSLAAGMKISDTIREVLKASGTGIQLAGYTARDFALTRPQAFFGRACETLERLADSVDGKAGLTPAGVCVIGTGEQTPTVVMPEDGLLSEPIFLKDRVILKTGIVGWPLGTCVRFRWNGADYQGVMMSRMLDLDNAGGCWESQVEVLGG